MFVLLSGTPDASLRLPGRAGQPYRAVHAIRIYDATEKAYMPLQARLEGCPPQEEEAQYWASLLEELRTKFGADLISKYLAKES